MVLYVIMLDVPKYMFKGFVLQHLLNKIFVLQLLATLNGSITMYTFKNAILRSIVLFINSFIS